MHVSAVEHWEQLVLLPPTYLYTRYARVYVGTDLQLSFWLNFGPLVGWQCYFHCLDIDREAQKLCFIWLRTDFDTYVMKPSSARSQRTVDICLRRSDSEGTQMSISSK